jgi:uracil-DNA glycosylase
LSPPPDNRLHAPLAAVFDGLPGGWRPLIERWRANPAGRSLEAFVQARLAAGAVVYPADPLRALRATPFERTRVVILGQDPYHGAGQAEGLAFSVPDGVGIPPSLRNLFEELQRDLGCALPASGHLGPWARQGVLLLNATLTVEQGRPASHAKRGWEALTDDLVEVLAMDARPKAFLLWGLAARGCATRIEAAGAQHLVLQANHPSPLSAGRRPLPFIGCGHFARARDFVRAHSAEPFDWTLP